MRYAFLLAMGATWVTGMIACDIEPTRPFDQDVASAFCGSTNITGGAEPPSPQFSCATGTSTNPVHVNWGSLRGTLCLTTGIPAAGLGGFQCTDPSTMTVVVSEKGRQHLTAELVQGSLGGPSVEDPFGSCTPTGAGTIDVEPNSVTAQDSATFTITQESADFDVGAQAEAPPICSVAIADGHEQHILVNIGMQVFVNCANASCTGSASPSSNAWRRHD